MDFSRPLTKDPDGWLEQAPDLSGALCTVAREQVHQAAPELGECIKWNTLCFQGHALVLGLAACRKHLGVFFFRGAELPRLIPWNPQSEANTSLRNFRVQRLEELPIAPFRRLVQAAVSLDREGPRPPPPKPKRAPWPMPEALGAALAQDKQAQAGFNALAPTYQREYLVWVSQAKREETGVERIRVTLAALRRGRKWAERPRD